MIQLVCMLISVNAGDRMEEMARIYSRPLIALLVSLLLLGSLHAGEPLYFFSLVENDPSTRLDDEARPVMLRWHEQMSPPTFYYSEMAGNIILPGVIFENENQRPNEPEVLASIQRAMLTWNNSRFGDFSFNPTVAPVSMAPTYPLNRYYIPWGSALDGINLISFIDDTVFSDDSSVAQTSFAFFNRDLKASDMMQFWEYSPRVIDASHSGQTTSPIVTFDFDGDGFFDIFIPYLDYKAGHLFDTDIMVNPGNTQYLRAWPENYEDIPMADRADVLGSLDIQMIMTHELGNVAGLGNSLIHDSVMNPFYEPATSMFPSDPYRRRVLAFDDEMTMGVAHGSFPAESASISGYVYEGALLDSTFVNDLTDLFVTQAPVFLMVRPDQLAQSSWLNCGRSVELNLPHPDDTDSIPIVPNASQGTWRAVAHVLTGNNVSLPVSPGDEIFFPIQGLDLEDPSHTGGNPIFGEMPGFTDRILEELQMDSFYRIPGLPATDDTGLPIQYALMLGLVSPVDEEIDMNVSVNAVHSLLAELEVYPPEFYGGLRSPVPLGDGSALALINYQDNQFENNFITVEVDQAGRIAGAINDGPAILSGFQQGPRSFINIATPTGTFTNRVGMVGMPVEAVMIDDINKSATGVWQRNNNFSLRQRITLSPQGGQNGIPAGMRVSYALTNSNPNEPATFSLRQVLDAVTFGRENPIYAIDGQPIEREITLSGTEVPRELHYQSTLNEPIFKNHITLRGSGLTPPDRLLVGRLSRLGGDIAEPGAQLIGPDATSLDTGVALVWDNITLGPLETANVAFIVGFFKPGQLLDGFADIEVNLFNQIIGGNDDFMQVEPLTLEPGQHRDNVDIYTNTGIAAEGAAQTVDPEDASGYPLQLVASGDAFPFSDNIFITGALGDIDNDGDQDVIACGYGGGADPISGMINRVYLNEQRIEPDGTITTFFRDVTFGEDGIPGTVLDRIKGRQPAQDPKDGWVYSPAPANKTVGIALADFNNDGWLDIYFSNQDAPDRFYLNEGEANPGFFIDQSQQWVPGLLNFPLDTKYDYPSRVAAGDIDSDGDMDLIISLFQPSTDWLGTPAWIDTDPAWTPTTQPDGWPTDSADFFSIPLVFTERVLINQTNQPTYAIRPQGNYFVDETLGADDLFGTVYNLQAAVDDFGSVMLYSWEPADLDRMPPVFPPMVTYPPTSPPSLVDSPQANVAWEPRLAPMFSGGGLDLASFRPLRTYTPSSGIVPDTSDPSGEYPFASIINGSAIRGPATLPEYGFDQGYFRNLDLFTNDNAPLPINSAGPDYIHVQPDGISDGYFACVNYVNNYPPPPFNRDDVRTFSRLPGLQVTGFFDGDGNWVATGTMATSTIRGLFAYRMEGTAFIYDANPLFIGMPQGSPFHEGGIDPIPDHTQSWTGVIDDWEYLGAPTAFVAADNDTGPFYIHATSSGARRNQPWSGYVGFSGVANELIENVIDTYPYGTMGNGPGIEPAWVSRAIAGPGELAFDYGEAYGSVSGDFNRDGNQDIFIATTSQIGISNSDPLGFWIVGQPARNLLFLNHGFGFNDEAQPTRYPEALGSVIGEDHFSMDAKAGDVDNDGDIDVVVFNANAPIELLINTTFDRKPPNLSDRTDARMFYDSSQTILPPHYGGLIAPPFEFIDLTGVTMRTSVADLNMDGRPDLLSAEGGSFTQAGDFSRILIHGGEPMHSGQKVYRPFRGAYPPPAVDVLVGYPDNGLGTIGERAYNFDIVTGDVDNDGDPDVLLVRSEPANSDNPPRLYINQDSDVKRFNTWPDPDQLGDGLLAQAGDHQWPNLQMPIPPSADNLNLKRQGRRGAFADLDGDGNVDVILANARSDSGAPNVILMNRPGDSGFSFTDETELRLPLSPDGLIGVLDSTNDMVAGDFDHDGDVDIIFANASLDTAPIGFRFMVNNGQGFFTDDDPTFAAPDDQRRIPKFLGLVPRGIVAADFDGLGEWTEDVNGNGHLDPGEDLNGNGVIDWIDKPSETEDLNGNGTLDPGEDVGIIGPDGTLIGAGNGQIDRHDRNGDGIHTAYRDGAWEGSLDLFISFGPRQIGSTEGEYNRLLINDPTNTRPGYFQDQTFLRFGQDLTPDPSAGVAVGDIDLDGDLDIVVAQLVGGNQRRFVKIWENVRGTVQGQTHQGFFRDVTYEVPQSNSTRVFLTEEDLALGIPDNLTGWATDVALLDLDGDGDLDMHVSLMGTIENMVPVGATNLFFVNRLIGDNWNAVRNRPLVNSSPRVTGLSPRGASRGQSAEVTVYGFNFLPGVELDFGQGVVVQSIERIDELNVRVTLQIDGAAMLGPRQVTVRNLSGGSTSTKAGMFSIYDTELINPIGQNSTGPDWLTLE